LKYLYALLVFAPIVVVLDLADIGGHSLIFVLSALSMVPLAAILSRATEGVAVHTGPKIGSLLNATLGNAAELIIATIALNKGLTDVVKASIAGSIIGNILIVLGVSILLGGLKNGTQVFDAKAAGVNATMMSLAVIALCVPALFSLGAPIHRPSRHDIERLSDGMAFVLIGLYVLYILFSLRNGSSTESEEGHGDSAGMGLLPALGLLGGAAIGIVIMSEIFVGAIEPTAESWGLTELFVGVMLLPVVGNVAELFVTARVAAANKMDLGLGIAVGSGLQVALFVTPVLVLAGWILDKPMTLVFNGFELTALVAATLVAVLISVDGESNWLEGVQLVALYAILGIAFYVVP
jgi:Ca2+:H+ antiporter